jgi:hypothetical protein
MNNIPPGAGIVCLIWIAGALALIGVLRRRSH